jgi:hypothetical protein
MSSNLQQIKKENYFEQGIRAIHVGNWRQARSEFQKAANLKHTEEVDEWINLCNEELKKISSINSKNEESPYRGKEHKTLKPSKTQSPKNQEKNLEKLKSDKNLEKQNTNPTNSTETSLILVAMSNEYLERGKMALESKNLMLAIDEFKNAEQLNHPEAQECLHLCRLILNEEKKEAKVFAFDTQPQTKTNGQTQITKPILNLMNDNLADNLTNLNQPNIKIANQKESTQEIETTNTILKKLLIKKIEKTNHILQNKNETKHMEQSQYPLHPIVPWNSSKVVKGPLKISIHKPVQQNGDNGKSGETKNEFKKENFKCSYAEWIHTKQSTTIAAHVSYNCNQSQDLIKLEVTAMAAFDKNQIFIEYSKNMLCLGLYFPQDQSEYKLQLYLFDTIKPTDCSFQHTENQLQIVLQKSQSFMWPSLQNKLVQNPSHNAHTQSKSGPYSQAKNINTSLYKTPHNRSIPEMKSNPFA